MTDVDRVKRSLWRALRPLFSRVDHAALYPGTVVSQNGDGTLEVSSTVPDKPHLSKVPVAYGVPGITATVNDGGAVMVGFMGADPALPYVLIYDAATVKSISLLGGTMPIARMGDGASVQLPPQAMYSGTFGNSTLSGVPVTMAVPFSGVIETGQLGALA
jgi:hypothetical protein